MNYINSWCRVEGGKVSANNNLIFEHSGPVANTATFLSDWYDAIQLAYPKFYKMDQLCQLGFLATEVLLAERFDRAMYSPESVGVVLANTSSCLNTDRDYLKSTLTIPSPALFVYTLPNIVIGEICIRNHFKGENAFFLFERFEPGQMCDTIDLYLSNDTTQALVAGWVEIIDNQCDALLYLIEKKKTEKSILYNQQIITELYGIIDARP